MSARTYPYSAWVLMPSFAPKEVVFVEAYRSFSNEDYGDNTEAGKNYQRSAIYSTKDEAIAAGVAQLNAQQVRLNKQMQQMLKRRNVLAKAQFSAAQAEGEER